MNPLATAFDEPSCDESFKRMMLHVFTGAERVFVYVVQSARRLAQR